MRSFTHDVERSLRALGCTAVTVTSDAILCVHTSRRIGRPRSKLRIPIRHNRRGALQTFLRALALAAVGKAIDPEEWLLPFVVGADGLTVYERTDGGDR